MLNRTLRILCFGSLRVKLLLRYHNCPTSRTAELLMSGVNVTVGRTAPLLGSWTWDWSGKGRNQQKQESIYQYGCQGKLAACSHAVSPVPQAGFLSLRILILAAVTTSRCDGEVRRHFGGLHCLHSHRRKYETQTISKKQVLSLLLAE
jgi:hypothetical protein